MEFTVESEGTKELHRAHFGVITWQATAAAEANRRNELPEALQNDDPVQTVHQT
jgi:hypothetical protein